MKMLTPSGESRDPRDGSVQTAVDLRVCHYRRPSPWDVSAEFYSIATDFDKAYEARRDRRAEAEGVARGRDWNWVRDVRVHLEIASADRRVAATRRHGTSPIADHRVANCRCPSAD